jgi:HK97 family phage major capsid protein
MTLKELRQKYQAKLAEARALLANGATAEIRTQYDALIAESQDIAGDIGRLSNLETAEAEERSRQEAEERALAARRPNLPQPGGESANQTETEQRSAQYRSAYARYVSTGDASELRAMGTTTGAGGGYGIPVDLQREIEQAVLTFGGVASSLRLLQTPTGETMDWPLSNDTANSATIITENNAASETDLTLAQTALNVSTLTTGIVLVSNQLLQDFQAADLSAFIQENLVERANRGLSGYIIGGSSDTNFSALNGVTVGATSAAPTAIGLPDITNIFGALDPAYASRPSSKWVMHRTTQLYLASLRNAYGTPIFPLDANGMLTKIYGQDIVIDQSMTALTANLPVAAGKYIVFGDLHKYILRKVNGFEIKRLNERYAEYNQTAFLMFFRAGAKYLDAGTHPIQILQQHA